MKINKKQVAKNFIKLIEIVEKLRSPGGCPWDKEQTHESLLPYLLEETYEVIESVEAEDWITLKEELGDVMLHVLLQAQIANENSKFNIEDSLKNINQKLIKRHPHVFGEKKLENSNQAKKSWEEMKHIEKDRASRLDGVPKTLPALNRAQRLQQKASYAGFDWENIEPIWEKLFEEIDELKQAKISGVKSDIEEEIGDLLFTVVNISRFLEVSAEDMLRKANDKFQNRFQYIENKLRISGETLESATFEQMNKIWDIAKKEE